MSHGADPTLANCHGKTALDIAASRELRDRILCRRLFRKSKINKNNLDEYNGYSFFDAIHQGDVSRVKKCLNTEMINFRHFKTGDSSLVR